MDNIPSLRIKAKHISGSTQAAGFNDPRTGIVSLRLPNIIETQECLGRRPDISYNCVEQFSCKILFGPIQYLLKFRHV